MPLIDFETELRDAIAARPGHLTVPEEWTGIPGTAFGGFVVGALFMAASEEAELKRPLSTHVRFYRPVPVGRAVRLVVQTERRGRGVEALRAHLFDEERPLVVSTAAFGKEIETPLVSQPAQPMPPLTDLVPTWRLLEEAGAPVPNVARRVGFRRPRVAMDPAERGDWHLHAAWPATTSPNPAVRAAVTTMCVDAFVGPATMVANDVDAMKPWPALAASIDLAAWFHDLGASPPTQSSEPGWLGVRTSVAATGGGFAVGRTQVWAGGRLAAEGMSQAKLIPI